VAEPQTPEATEIIVGQQEWEYHLVEGKTADRVVGKCRRLGTEGWELVSVTPPLADEERPTWRGFLKRPRAADE
jgi:hypothetical protein